MLSKCGWIIFLTVVVHTRLGWCSGAKRGEVIPGPWGDQGPLEATVIQGDDAPDCFFLSPLSIVARIDRQAIINAGSDLKTGGNWAINLYLDDAAKTLHTFQVPDKSTDENKKDKLSETPWVAVFERAMSEWFSFQNKPDQTKGGGGLVENSFKALYGPTTLSDPPYSSEFTNDWEVSLDVIRANATQWPMTFTTKKDLANSIPPHHTLGVHEANSTHIILRNPWGFILKKDEKDTDMPAGIIRTDDHGTFSWTLEEAEKAFAELNYAKIDGGSKIKVVSEIYDGVSSAIAQAAAQDTAAYNTKDDPFNFQTTNNKRDMELATKTSSSLTSTGLSPHVARHLSASPASM